MFPMESEGAFNGYCTWVAGTLGGSVLTMNNLCWQNRIIVNASLVYLTNDEEAMDHLIPNCRVAQVLWSSVLSWFLCSWVFLCSLFVVFWGLGHLWVWLGMEPCGASYFWLICGFNGRREISNASGHISSVEVWIDGVNFHVASIVIIYPSSSWHLFCFSFDELEGGGFLIHYFESK